MRMMRLQVIRAGLIAAVAALAALAPAVGSGQAVQFVANLTGASEVPPVTTTATGTFSGVLDEAAGTLTWALQVPAITAGTAAHIHTGAAGVNGPIVIPLFAAPSGSPASSIGVTGTARVADLAGPLAGDFAAFAAALKAGTLYVNVHTTANPGGEIRGQLVAAAAAPPPAVPAPAPAGNAGLALNSDTGVLSVVMLAVGLAVLAGGRALTRRRVE